MNNLKAQDILNILHNHDKIVDMDLTLPELQDITEFVKSICNIPSQLYADIVYSIKNYEKMCDWHEREPQDVTEQDCDDSFWSVKWRVQQLAEEACKNSFFA